MSQLPAASRRHASWVVAPVVCAALLSGCTGADPDDPSSTPPAASPTSAPTTASPSAAPPAAAATEVPRGDGGPEDSFLTWLAASRAPDVGTACAYMTPELAQRMVDEVTAQGLPGITDCPSLIEMTAGLYAAAGQSSETTVELREQSEERAVLHVTYVAGRSCGLVVLQPGDGHWVLDERSKEEC